MVVGHRSDILDGFFMDSSAVSTGFLSAGILFGEF